MGRRRRRIERRRDRKRGVEVEPTLLTDVLLVGLVGLGTACLDLKPMVFPPDGQSFGGHPGEIHDEPERRVTLEDIDGRRLGEPADDGLEHTV